MDNRDKILSMLGGGLDAGVVATAVGVTPGYISQLLAEPEFALAVAEKRTLELTQAKSIDEKWDEFEEALLAKLKDLIPFFSSPKHIMEALKIANSAKRKTALNSNPTGGGAGNTYVTISMPSVLVQAYKINMGGGLVEVAGRSLKPMPSDILMKTLKERNGGSDGKEPKLLEGNVKEARRAGQEISIDTI